MPDRICVFGLSITVKIAYELCSDASRAAASIETFQSGDSGGSKLRACSDPECGWLFLGYEQEPFKKMVRYETVWEPDSFHSLFVSAHTEKREKATNAITNAYRFLHLGPHAQISDPNSNPQPTITRQDARFALTVTQTIFEYITPDA